jgi:hypothetical protein
MKLNYLFPFLIGGAVLATMNACSEVKASSNEAGEKTEAVSSEKETMLNQYSEVPREEMMGDAALWAELKGKYQQNLTTLNDKIKATGAKLVVMYVTPEFGESMTPTQRDGKPFIENACTEMGIDFVDLTTSMIGKKPEEVTHMPIDGHWSKAGAQLLATDLEKVITANTAHKATATYAERPTLFGDQKAKQDEVLDGGKSLPYRLQTNGQGLRMDYDLAFPKTKQRILFIGDSGFFFPFMDNKDIVSNLLQAKFADKEFANACNWGYAMDDYISLFDERAKYIEPDVVLLQTSGTDIMDMYFSHRNRFSRSKQASMPSATEKAFYEKTFKK